MKKQWNEEQKKAIETRHKNILVSASAGSGKTGVLVGRLIGLVTKDHIEIDQILAMTFSEDAASEMKKRLSSEISQLCENEEDPKQAEFLKRQLSKLNDAHISTIHSFCYSIIKQYYYLIDLDSSRISHLLDPSLQQVYQNQALDQILNQAALENDEIFQRLSAIFNNRIESMDGIREAILKIAQMADSQKDAVLWLDQSLKNQLPDSFYDSQIYQVFIDYWKGQLTLYQQAMDTLFNELNEHYPSEEKRYAALIKKQEASKKMIHFTDFDQLRTNMIYCSKLTLPTSPDAANLNFKNARETIQNIEDELISLPPVDVMNQMMLDFYPCAQRLIHYVKAYLNYYAKIKEEKEVIDFSDMEHFALQILRNHEFIREKYRSLFYEIMVDEFQDSNDVQDELVHLIAKKNNVFRVGDVKQSIYGFRHALPSIMQSYKEKEDENSIVIRFNRNYRSDATIIEFNNVLFEILMNIEGFNSLPFQKEDFSQIGLDKQKSENQPIVFHALSPELHSYEGEKINKDVYKAEYIAHEILEQSKHYEFKDMAVLVRNNAKMDILKQVFEKYHIPYYMNHKSGFYESGSIQLLISLLSSLADPDDDYHFAALLTSRFFNFSSYQLATLSRLKKSSYYEALLEQQNPSVMKFEELRTSHLLLSEIIQECFKWNHFYDTLSLQDQTNCDYFFQIALDFENSISCEITGFLSYLESLKQQETAQTSTIGKNDNVVRFMSIHNSKGLEFPVVYLWTTSNMKKKETSDIVLCDNELGIGFLYMQLPYRNIFKSYQRIALEQKKNRDEIEEELRILYVATTRAKKQLHLVDFLDPKLDIDKMTNYTSINARKGTTSWILQSMFPLNRTDLFEFRFIDTLWKNEALEKDISLDKKLPIYDSQQEMILISPSETEAFDIQPLTFTTKKGTQRGTLYHAYLEKLPNTKWDRTIIEEVSQQYQYDLDEKLITSLLKLNNQPLFDSLRNTEIYHEYPFLVQHDNQVLNGFMDYLSVGDIITLIDFKSDSLNNKQLFIERYSNQIELYKTACHLLFPDKTIKAYIYSFSLEEMIMI